MYFNAHSIFDELNKFELLISDHKPDVVLITETITLQMLCYQYLVTH